MKRDAGLPASLFLNRLLRLLFAKGIQHVVLSDDVEITRIIFTQHRPVFFVNKGA